MSFEENVLRVNSLVKEGNKEHPYLKQFEDILMTGNRQAYNGKPVNFIDVSNQTSELFLFEIDTASNFSIISTLYRDLYANPLKLFTESQNSTQNEFSNKKKKT